MPRTAKSASAQCVDEIRRDLWAWVTRFEKLYEERRPRYAQLVRELKPYWAGGLPPEFDIAAVSEAWDRNEFRRYHLRVPAEWVAQLRLLRREASAVVQGAAQDLQSTLRATGAKVVTYITAAGCRGCEGGGRPCAREDLRMDRSCTEYASVGACAAAARAQLAAYVAAFADLRDRVARLEDGAEEMVRLAEWLNSSEKARAGRVRGLLSAWSVYAAAQAQK
jgi:hypothetical protein